MNLNHTRPAAWALTGVPHMPDAACKYEDPLMWQLPHKPSGNRTHRDLTAGNRVALTICGTCPTIDTCDQQTGIIRADVVLAGKAYGSTSNGKPVILATSKRDAA